MNTPAPQKPQTQDQPRTVVLKPLEPHLLEQFAADMQDAFQTAVERAPETMPLPILPREDIDQSLSHPGAEALTAWGDGQLIGGAIIFPNYETQHHECALLYVSATAHGSGWGSALWQAIENHYPQAVSWELCTPYFETRNIGFYLRKCGFRIVDIFEEKHPEDAPPAEEENQPDLMFSFIKRLDGRWV